MKYSLKNQYKHLLKEDTIKVISQDDVVNNQTVTRIYNLDNPQKYDPVSTLTITPSKVYDIGAINNFIDKAQAKTSGVNFNRKSITLSKTNNIIDVSLTLEKNTVNILHNSYFDVIENKIISCFFTNDSSAESYLDAIDKSVVMSNITKIDIDCFLQTFKRSIKSIIGDRSLLVREIPKLLDDTLDIKIKSLTLKI